MVALVISTTTWSICYVLINSLVFASHIYILILNRNHYIKVGMDEQEMMVLQHSSVRKSLHSRQFVLSRAYE